MAGATLTSHNVSARNADVSAAISGAPLHPQPLQDVHDPRRGGPGDSPDDAFLISDCKLNCGNSNNRDDSQSDTTLPPLDMLLTAPRNSVTATGACLTSKVGYTLVRRADKDINGTPSSNSNSDANESTVTS